MKARIITIIYFLAVGAHLIAQMIGSEELARFTKPVLMPILIFMVYVYAQGTVTLPRLLLVVALIFSWIGDLLLMGTGELYFIGGLGAFLVAQLLYAFILSKSVFAPLSLRWIKLVPILITGGILLALLLPNAGKMLLPIFVYSLCILSMLSAARLREALTTTESFQWALFGAVLFVLSDSTLAINKFVWEVPMSGLWIMLTYTIAQYFLALGIMKHPG